MMPLLPEEVINSEVLDLIIAAWRNEAPVQLKNAFDRLAKTIRRTYVGAPQGQQPPRPRFPPHLWSVSGRSVRTNNGAESLHSTINPKTKGRLSLHRFLAIIEKAMAKARDKIATGCEPEARPAVPEKNALLAVELHNLLGGWQGAISFLDNCASVISLKGRQDVARFVRRQENLWSDSLWSLNNRDSLIHATRNLFSPCIRLASCRMTRSVITSPSGRSKLFPLLLFQTERMKTLTCLLLKPKRGRVSSTFAKR